MLNKFIFIARILVGCLFVVSGFEKLISSYQNFLYVVQSYLVFSVLLEEIVARVLPWIEFFLGLFLITGLWLKWSLRATSTIFLLFILIVGQALIRKLPIDECGCFGGLISLPLYVVLIFDSTVFALTIFMQRRLKPASAFSLDHYFNS